MSAWVILKWVQELFVRWLIIENVPEFLSWGPLDDTGHVIKERKGETFSAFITALRSLGYQVDWRILNAADFGAPTTRRRLFIQAVRDGKRILWPEPKYNPENWRPASSIIDWSIQGASIFRRKRPLADATMRRIEYGIKKYWGEWAEPFLVILRGTGRVRDIHHPTPTITAGGQHIGIVEPLVLNQWGGGEARPVSHPLATVGTTCAHRLIEPFIVTFDNSSSAPKNCLRSINKPLSTVIASNPRHGLIEPFIIKYYGAGNGAKKIDVPLDTVTTKDRFGLVAGSPAKLDITFRMLSAGELAAAQGFPEGYQFTGNKTDQVRQIGNAVCPPVAKALAMEANS
jgi:DNA (cytosine-5)-methyltransferase 1